MPDTLPQGFLIRHPTMDDLEAVTALINTCELAEDGEAETTVADMRTAWLSPNYSLASDAWVVAAPTGQIVAFADMHHREHANIFSDVKVHPDYCGRGIGTYLLHLIEAHAQEHIPLAAPNVRVTLNPWVSGTNTAAHRLLEQAGYTLVRRFWRMEIEMREAPPEPAWPQGFTVRTFVPGQDERAVYETDEEAFQDHWGHVHIGLEEWEHWMVKREGFDPTLWFLAYDGNTLAGISLCKKEKDLGWVDTLAVLRPWRQKGLGMALLLHSFGEFYRRGMRKAGLGVDSQNLTGATRLYERAGMHVAREGRRYQKELRPGVEPSVQALSV